MMKNRIIYAVWLILSISLFVMLNNISTLILLSLSILLPIVFLIFAKISCDKIVADIVVETNCKKNENINGKLKIKNNSFLPVANVNCKIKCNNLLNGKSENYIFATSLGAKGQDTIPFNISSKYCGKIEVSISSLEINDLFKIFSLRSKKHNNSIAIITVSPEIFNSEIIVSENIYSNFDSDIYSMDKSGNDPSETFMIREYVAGDSIKNIHYKLSQKLDKLMVRELGQPILNDVLLLFDMSYSKLSPSNIDVIMDCFASISLSLIDASINYSVSYKDNESETLQTENISSNEDALAFIDKVMANTFKAEDNQISEFFAENSDRKNYQHIVLITANDSVDISPLYNYNRVNVLLLSQNDIDIHSDGGFVTRFSKDDYKNALSLLEI
jgi:hypothetical protein